MLVEFNQRWGAYRPLQRTDLLGEGQIQILEKRGIVKRVEAGKKKIAPPKKAPPPPPKKKRGRPPKKKASNANQPAQ